MYWTHFFYLEMNIFNHLILWLNAHGRQSQQQRIYRGSPFFPTLCTSRFSTRFSLIRWRVVVVRRRRRRVMTTVPQPHQNGTELLQTSTEHTHTHTHPCKSPYNIHTHSSSKTYSIRYEFLWHWARFTELSPWVSFGIFRKKNLDSKESKKESLHIYISDTFHLYICS